MENFRPRRTALALLVAVLATFFTWVAAPTPASAAYPLGQGYWMTLDDGTVVTFGDAQYYGSMRGIPLNSPIVGMAPFPFLEGYWLVAADGGIFSYGASKFHGSMGGTPLNKPIVGITPTSTGKGYWMVASDGGIFAFGDAKFHGSMGGTPLNKPIIAMAVTPTGNGYWMVASDGGMFAFGDAGFHGSLGGVKLVLPITGMTPTASGKGYYLVASDGGIFAFGDAVFRGGKGGSPIPAPITGMALSTSGLGYNLVGRDGSVYSFGDAPNFGGLNGLRIPSPVRSMAMRPRLAVQVTAFGDRGNSFSYWAPQETNTTLQLISFGGAAGARISGVEGLDVSQLGTISYKRLQDDCVTFALLYDDGAAANKTKLFECINGTSTTPAFNPSTTSGVPGTAKILGLEIWYTATTGMGFGATEVDDITIAGITVQDSAVYRQP